MSDLWTLRDVRRVLAHAATDAWGMIASYHVRWFLAQLFTSGLLVRDIIPHVDALIARYGAHATTWQVLDLEHERAKTKEDPGAAMQRPPPKTPSAPDGQESERTEQSEPSESARAGRGSSPRAGGRRSEPSGEETPSDSDGDSPRVMSPMSDNAQSDAPTAMPDGAQGGATDESDKSAKDGAQEGSDECAQSGDAHDGTDGIEHIPRNNGMGSADDTNAEPTQSPTAAGSGASPSRHSRAVHGGVTCDLSLRGRKQKLARRIRRELQRVLRLDTAPSGDPSPRVDGRQLVRELASRRVALSRARKAEVSRELCVLAVDVSGSCSSFSTELWIAATALAVEFGGDVIESDEEHAHVRTDIPIVVIVHSNGWVGETGLAEFILRLQRPLSTVIVLGDCDGAEDYRALCERGARMIWLDNYCASHKVARASTRATAATAAWCRRPLAHLQGVGSGEDTLAALQLVRT